MEVVQKHALDPGERQPIFVAPGVIKVPAQFRPFMKMKDRSLAPAVLSIGTFVTPKWFGNATPDHPVDTVYYPDLDMYGNARGLPGDGIRGLKKFKTPIRQLLELTGIKTNVSISNLPHENPMDVIPSLAYAAAEIEPTAIEVNLSCPNGKKPDGSFHQQVCNTPEAAAEVMQAVREAIGYEVCLGAKDSPHVNSLQEEVDSEAVMYLIAAIRPYIDFLVGVNTIGNQPFPEITSTGGRGGMSGPIIAGVAKQHLAYAKQYAPDLAYLSCGGIETKNISIELPIRLAMGAFLVGGAQEPYRNIEDISVVTDAWANRISQSKVLH